MASANILNLDDNNFDSQINKGATPVLVDFWAPWCGPCKMMGPEFDKAARALAGKARLVKVNTQAHQSVSGKMRIKGIPTMIVWQNGREVKRQAGAMKMGQIVGWVPKG